MIRLANAASGSMGGSAAAADVTLEVIDAGGGVREGGRLVLVLDAPHAAIRWNIRAIGRAGSKLLSDPFLEHTVVVSFFFLFFLVAMIIST